MPPHDHDHHRPAVALRTGDPALTAALQRIAAAAGCGPLPGASADPAAPGGPDLLLLGADVLGPPAASTRPGAGEVVVVAVDPTPDDLWQRAVDAGADHVAVLPEAEGWLLERLVDVVEARDGAGGHGALVGVVGGCGGAGASVLAAALATTAAARGTGTLLVDADPRGGGLDLLLGAEEVPGLRWPDLLQVQGRLRADVLHALVPAAEDLQVLSWTRDGDHELPADAVDSVLSAARRSHELTVVDAPCRLDPATVAALAACDEVLLVVPARVRAAAAAGRVVAALAGRAGDLRLVVRGPAPAGLSAGAVVDAVGLPLAADLPPERGLDVSLDRGEGVPLRRRSPLRAWCEEWLEELEAARALAGARSPVVLR